MKKLLSSKSIAKAINIDNLGGEVLAKMIMQFFKLNKINKLYSDIDKINISEFIDEVFKHLEIEIEVSEKDLENIPKEGAFISVSNHPLGGIDGLILLKIMLDKRPNFKILGNFVLNSIPQLSKMIIPVNPFENKAIAKESSFSGLKTTLKHLNDANPLGIFPAGEVSSYQTTMGKITDREWSTTVLKLIRKASVPVVPIYFQGANSRLFHLLGKVHPLLRTVKLPSEMLNKKGQIFTVQIGKPIPVSEQKKFSDIPQFGRFLRAKTYMLNKDVKVKKFFNNDTHSKSQPLPVIDKLPNKLLEIEIEKLRDLFLLFSVAEFDIFCTPAGNIPNLMNEIGRLREITFRKVGEGTGKSIDIDEYDLYYNQLIIWDRNKNQVAGGYRLGLGNDIMNQFGMKGLYSRSLFKFDKEFEVYLRNGIELGRSFITSEYQRHPLPLFLLWKGILYFIIKNSNARFLFGPVSISNDFSTIGKSLMVKFMKSNYFDPFIAKLVKPRKQFRLPKKFDFDMNFIIENSGNDFIKIDKFIKDTHFGMPIPVLLKKYITSLNAKVIGFNVDPNFNNCLDGLILLDIYDIPFRTIQTLSEELNEKELLKKFHIKPLTNES